MVIHTLTFKNKDASDKVLHIVTDTESFEHILRWYGAYRVGDRYTSSLDGAKLKLDQNGELKQ